MDEKGSTRAFENLDVASGYYSNAEAGEILSGGCDEEMREAGVEQKKRERRGNAQEQNENRRTRKRSENWR